MTEARILVGDCREVLRTLDADSFDSCVTDPPYHLTNSGGGPHGKGIDTPFARARAGASTGGFMGLKWDGGDVAMRAETWAEVLRVLKPGAFLLAFGGTRTHHRIWCAIEDAGFEVRDTLGWLYGSGFPKGTDKSKIPAEWQGWNTALKPAWEPICLARKPLVGTLAENLAAHGVGAMNIDASRVAVLDDAYGRNHSGDRGHAGTRSADKTGATDIRSGGGMASDIGRWPANILHDGSDDVLAVFPDEAGAVAPVRGTEPSAPAKNVYGTYQRSVASNLRDELGSAARFFWCPKASRSDRNAGCEGMRAKPLRWSSGDQNPGSFQSKGTDKTSANHHPTVKPTELMRYLCAMVTPPGGRVIDPFCGSGSTARGALPQGFSFVGIELDPEYAEIARARSRVQVGLPLEAA